MKKNSLIFVILALISLSSCKKVPHSGEMTFANETDSVSYVLGYMEAVNYKQGFDYIPFEVDSLTRIQLAKSLSKAQLSKKYVDLRKDQFGDLDEKTFMKAFVNELAYGKSYFTEMSANIYLQKTFQQKKVLKDSVKKELAKNNLEKGKAFLAKNKQRKEVVETESGLQYEIVKKGTGKIATKEDQVKCVYHGTLLDNTVFDSSKERGDTISFGLNRVIRGWTEALQLMPEGSLWRLYIPANLAYGAAGKGDIGPNETLIFDIDLVEVVKAKKK